MKVIDLFDISQLHVTRKQQALLLLWFPGLPRNDEHEGYLLKKGWLQYVIDNSLEITEEQVKIYNEASFSTYKHLKASKQMLFDALNKCEPQPEYPHMRFLHTIRKIKDVNPIKIQFNSNSDTFIEFEYLGKIYHAACTGEKLNDEGYLKTEITCEGITTDLTFKDITEYIKSLKDKKKVTIKIKK